MTEATMLAVVKMLNDKDIPAYYEYPGYISLALPKHRINYSDEDNLFHGQVCDAEGEYIEGRPDLPLSPGAGTTDLSEHEIIMVVSHVEDDYHWALTLDQNYKPFIPFVKRLPRTW